jgi:hypothetical protein
MYAYENTEHLEGMKILNRNVWVSPTKIQKFIQKGRHRPLLIGNIVQIQDPIQNGCEGVTRNGHSKNWNMKKGKCTPKGVYKIGNNRFMTGRFHRKYAQWTIRNRTVTKGYGIPRPTPERHCRQWHPNSQIVLSCF